MKKKWNQKEWEVFSEKLRILSFQELSKIASLTGIKFTEGIENLSDNRNITAKEQIILVLEECEKEDLEKALRQVTTGD